MDNTEKTIQFLDNNQAGASDIAEHLSISRQAVHRLLNTLVAEGRLTKVGRSPRVYYSVPAQMPRQAAIQDGNYTVASDTKKLIEDNFLYITPFGQKRSGWEGFVEWCVQRSQDVPKMAHLYKDIIGKYVGFKKNGLIDGMAKIASTFDDVALDEVFYLDFYSIEIFGKTKLGQLLLFAKQSQDKALMDQLTDSIRPVVLDVIEKYKIDGVAFIPPTVKRERQLMKQIERRLELNKRTVSLVKIKTPVIVPQKTLTKLEDRVTNARETIIVDEAITYANILLIDDAIGSGATLNEVAKKIRVKGICTGKIIGLAVTGSVKGFDVISEV